MWSFGKRTRAVLKEVAKISIAKMSNCYILIVSCQKGPTRHTYAWQIEPFWQDTLDLPLANESTPKKLEMHGCKLSTVATNALVLIHQAISSYRADSLLIAVNLFHKKITFTANIIQAKFIFRKI